MCTLTKLCGWMGYQATLNGTLIFGGYMCGKWGIATFWGLKCSAWKSRLLPFCHSPASINFWCQLVASPATAASWMSVVAMVGWGYQAGLANCHVWWFSPPACQWQPSFVGLAVQCWYLEIMIHDSAVHVLIGNHISTVGCCLSNARFYELGLTRDSRVIPGLTVVSVLSTSNLRLNWD